MEEKNNAKSDQELVALTLQDRHAFVAIVERYELALRRYIARIGCRDPHDQDDILQETFLKTYLNLNDYDPHLKFSSWVYHITHNEAVSFFRKKNTLPKPVITEKELSLFLSVADRANIIEAHIKKDEAEIVRQALAEMDERYREALVLKFIEERSYSEISDIFKIPIGTVGTLINRGKKQLRRMLHKKI